MLISGLLLSSSCFDSMALYPLPSHTHLQSRSFDWITSRLPLFIFELSSTLKDPLTSVQGWQIEGLLDIRWYLQVWWNRYCPLPLLLLQSIGCSAWKTKTSYCDTPLSQLTLQWTPRDARDSPRYIFVLTRAEKRFLFSQDLVSPEPCYSAIGSSSSSGNTVLLLYHLSKANLHSKRHPAFCRQKPIFCWRERTSNHLTKRQPVVFAYSLCFFLPRSV